MNVFALWTLGWTEQVILRWYYRLCFFHCPKIESNHRCQSQPCYQFIPAGQHQVLNRYMLFCSVLCRLINKSPPLSCFQWNVSHRWAEYQIAFYYQEIASLQDGDPGGMTQSLPPHRRLEKMHWTVGNVFVVLVSLITSHTAGALSVDTDGNHTQNGNVTDDGFVPGVFTKVSQIIAREGSCALIDCNVTGDPFPRVQWFNSHGDRLDTETTGESDCVVTLNPGPLFSLSLCYFISREGVRCVVHCAEVWQLSI